MSEGIKQQENNTVITNPPLPNECAIVAGGRNFVPFRGCRSWLKEQLRANGIKGVVQGGARGADAFGKDIAIELGLWNIEVPAQWNRFGKSAGYMRNVEMSLKAGTCILFPGGRGTRHMENIAREKGLKIIKWGA